MHGGNVGILAVGDLYLLPLVKASCLLKPNSNMGIDLLYVFSG